MGVDHRGGNIGMPEQLLGCADNLADQRMPPPHLAPAVSRIPNTSSITGHKPINTPDWLNSNAADYTGIGRETAGCL